MSHCVVFIHVSLAARFRMVFAGCSLPLQSIYGTLLTHTCTSAHRRVFNPYGHAPYIRSESACLFGLLHFVC